MEVYLEVGRRRAFAVALEWPGWCRAGRDEGGALAALIEYGARYRTAVEGVASVDVPAGGAELRVVERLAGGAATDFGAPEAIPAADRRALAPAELEQLLAIHAACWSTLLDVARRASGRPLTSGPRGGGRSLPAILEHAAGAETAYLSQLGGRDAGAAGGALALRDSFAASARARAAGELPDRGPRGGQRWPARYAIRRSAWHLLDHAWEIEDRAGLGAPDG